MGQNYVKQGWMVDGMGYEQAEGADVRRGWKTKTERQSNYPTHEIFRFGMDILLTRLRECGSKALQCFGASVPVIPSFVI